MGFLGFGRKSWPAGETPWPSGLWLENLRLEILTADDTDPPYAYISLSHKAKCNFDFDTARDVLYTAAKDLLTPEELKGTTSEESGNVLLWLPAPSKAELLGPLSDGNGERFVGLFVSQFDMMSRFVPVLDRVFKDCMRAT